MPRLQHHSHPDGFWPSCDDEPPGVSIQPFSHADLAALLAHLDTTKTRATPSAGSGRRRWWRCGCGPASAAPAPPRRVPARRATERRRTHWCTARPPRSPCILPEPCQPRGDRSARKLLRRLRWVDGLVDPHLLWEAGRLGWLADEPLGVGGEGGVQDHASREGDLLGAAVMHIGRSQQPNT
jgi:hypothetical protein